MSLYDNQLPYSNDFSMEKLYDWEVKARSSWNRNKCAWIEDELNRGETWRAQEWLKKHDGKLMIMDDFSAFRLGLIVRDGMLTVWDEDKLVRDKNLHQILEFMREKCAFIPIRALDSHDLAKNKWMHGWEWDKALEGRTTEPHDEAYYKVEMNARSRKYSLKMDDERTESRNEYFKNFDTIWGK